MKEGKRLRARRIELRLTQKELASRLGMKRWIPIWECGRNPPPPFIWLALEKLAEEQKLN